MGSLLEQVNVSGFLVVCSLVICSSAKKITSSQNDHGFHGNKANATKGSH